MKQKEWWERVKLLKSSKRSIQSTILKYQEKKKRLRVQETQLDN
jgi:hypothetical protein